MSRLRRHFPFPLLGIALVALALAACRSPAAPPPAGTPRLVLLLVVDQMRADYFHRFGPLLEGGLATLRERGVVFTEAAHDHNSTLTAPGHATLATGCHPSRHGIVGNYWYDRETGELGYSVEDGGPGRLLCSGLGDWLQDRYPEARVFSASQKDRSAVMMGGQRGQAAFWYDWDTGGFESSSHYFRQLPEWLVTFNQEQALSQHFGTAWRAGDFDPELLSELGVEAFDFGPLDPGFPLTFGGLSLAPGESFYSGLYTSPFADEQLGRLAIRLINAEGLGDDEVPDLLALGFSSLDAVGHRFGPSSPQVMETVLALDRTLGLLLEEVDRQIGLDHVVVALTSDHGVAPLPELQALRGLPGERVAAEHVLCVQGAESKLDAKLGRADWLRPGGFIEPAALTAHDVEAVEVERALQEILEACPGVEKVWTRSELTAETAASDPLRRPFVNGFHPRRSADFAVQWAENFLPYSTLATNHGSVYRYDRWVPLILLAPGVPPGEVGEPVRTVDLAPTLAALVGVEPSAEIDGRPLDLRSR